MSVRKIFFENYNIWGAMPANESHHLVEDEKVFLQYKYQPEVRDGELYLEEPSYGVYSTYNEENGFFYLLGFPVSNEDRVWLKNHTVESGESENEVYCLVSNPSHKKSEDGIVTNGFYVTVYTGESARKHKRKDIVHSLWHDIKAEWVKILFFVVVLIAIFGGRL